jgi:hypothetical protein
MKLEIGSTPPLERYEQRAAHFLEEVKHLEARSRGYSNLRLAIFLIGVLSGLIFPKNTPFWILLLTTLLLLLLVLFIAAAIRHQVIEERLQTSREMARRNEEGKARIARNWKDLPDRSRPADLVSNVLARDLDLFGRAATTPTMVLFSLAVRVSHIVSLDSHWLFAAMAFRSATNFELRSFFLVGMHNQEKS